MEKDPMNYSPDSNRPESTEVQSLRQKLVSRMPPGLQSKLEEHMPTIQSNAKIGLEGAQEFLGPLWIELRTIMRNASKKLAKAGPTATVGSSFRHLCFVGLNRSELLLSGESQSVFNDNWPDLTSDNLKRHTALMFFAPRGLDGKPVNPYLFLVGEGTSEDSDIPDPNIVSLAEQTVGPMALLDLCRITPATPNTVNLLLVADTLFHWDVKDNYVLPTTATSWVRDLEMVLKSYPRTTRAHLYTQWDTDLLPPSERISIHSLRDFPLDDETWLNKPTFQERYGTHMMVLGLIIAGLAYTGLWFQGNTLQGLTDQLSVVEQQIPRGGQFSDLERAITEQEKMWSKRELFGLVVKDTARAMQNSGLKATSFEVRVSEPENPPVTYVVTIDAASDVYQGWLQQEPIARSLILNSAVLDAIRKPPTTSGFKLEGLVNANALARDFKPFASQRRAVPAVSGTAPVSPTDAAKSASTGPSTQFGTQSDNRLEPAAGNPKPYFNGGDQ